jgi:hypothetical protein
MRSNHDGIHRKRVASSPHGIAHHLSAKTWTFEVDPTSEPELINVNSNGLRQSRSTTGPANSFVRSAVRLG